MQQNQKLTTHQTAASPHPPLNEFRALVCLLPLCFGLTGSLLASENVPYRPFAEWANLPEAGQFVAGALYNQSSAYTIWTGGQYHNISVTSGGEYYGIDITQGFLTLQYGITKSLAVDVNFGGTTVGWRSFNTNGATESTGGFMDTSLGIRYQLLNEADTNSPWTPTLTFRLGAVLPGTYDANFAFAPGDGSAAVMPEFLLRKHFGWTGFGGYADCTFRWNFSTGDQYITGIGLFQDIKQWELAAGWRHLQTLSGSDIIYYPNGTINYPREVRENRDTIEAGFAYTTKRKVKWAFQASTVFSGNNTDRPFWLGGSVDVPFWIKKPK